MGGRASRSKGSRGESAARRLLIEQGYETFASPGGESCHDFLAIDRHGKAYSVEVKNTQSLAFAAYTQCKRNASGKSRILMWHPSRWGFPASVWCVLIWDGENTRIAEWRANAT